MKVIDLRCQSGHRFEGWFASDDDFLDQNGRGQIECPMCADKVVVRLPSAPRLNLSGAREPSAPPAAATYRATFDAYLADATTGTELPGTSTGPFELTWTSVPDGRPMLSIARKLVVSWPAASGNYVLESADSASAATWSVVPETVSNLGGNLTVLVEPAAAARVYRLRQVP